MNVEVYSMEPVTVKLPLGRQMETRQIAIIPLASTREGVRAGVESGECIGHKGVQGLV
jgi:hypothetical protein